MKRIIGIVLLIPFLNSCINKAYVPVMNEPMMLSYKKEKRLVFSQSSSTAKAQLAFATGNHVGMSISETFAKGVSNTEAVVAYFSNAWYSYYELGGGVGFQRNNIFYNGRGGGLLPALSERYYWESFSCSYAQAFISGCALWGNNKVKAGVGFKGGPLYIYCYNYDQKVNPYTGGSNPYPLDYEQTHFSEKIVTVFEPSFIFIANRTARRTFRMQFEYAGSTHAYEHKYSFYQTLSKSPYQERSKYHPDLRPFTFSIGYSWRIGKDPIKENMWKDYIDEYNHPEEQPK
ncbi:MAG: hypothetical protein ACXVC6_02130 [Bacteroidia bacterium]